MRALSWDLIIVAIEPAPASLQKPLRRAFLPRHIRLVRAAPARINRKLHNSYPAVQQCSTRRGGAREVKSNRVKLGKSKSRPCGRRCSSRLCGRVSAPGSLRDFTLGRRVVTALPNVETFVKDGDFLEAFVAELTGELTGLGVGASAVANQPGVFGELADVRGRVVKRHA